MDQIKKKSWEAKKVVKAFSCPCNSILDTSKKKRVEYFFNVQIWSSKLWLFKINEVSFNFDKSSNQLSCKIFFQYHAIL